MGVAPMLTRMEHHYVDTVIMVFYYGCNVYNEEEIGMGRRGICIAAAAMLAMAKLKVLAEGHALDCDCQQCVVINLSFPITVALAIPGTPKAGVSGRA